MSLIKFAQITLAGLCLTTLVACDSSKSNNITKIDISTPQAKTATYNQDFAPSVIKWLCGKSMGLNCPEVPEIGEIDPKKFDRNLSISVVADQNFEFVNVHIPMAWGQDEDIYCVYQDEDDWNNYAFNELVKEFFWDLKFNIENRGYPIDLLPSKGFIFTSEYLLLSKYEQDRLGIEIPRKVVKRWTGDRLGIATEDAKIIITDGDVFIDYRKAHTLGDLIWHSKSIDACWFTEDGESVGSWLRY